MITSHKHFQGEVLWGGVGGGGEIAGIFWAAESTGQTQQSIMSA